MILSVFQSINTSREQKIINLIIRVEAGIKSPPKIIINNKRPFERKVRIKTTVRNFTLSDLSIYLIKLEVFTFSGITYNYSPHEYLNGHD